MALPDSTNTAPRFIIDEPDFEQGFELVTKFRTDIATAHNDIEQRARRMVLPKYEVACVLGPFESAEWPARKSSLIQELGGPVVIPIWTRPVGFVSEVSDAVTVDTTITKREFRVGSYAFFRETGLASCFRLIELLTSNVITLATGNAAFPDITVPSYTSAAEVFPCVFGMREENAGEVFNHHSRQTRENVRVLQL